MKTRPTAEPTKPATPNPRPYPRLHVLADPEDVRRLHCRHYDRCLEVAEVGDWPGFTCDACDAYDPLTADEEARDLGGLLEAFAAAITEDPDLVDDLLPRLDDPELPEDAEDAA